MKRRAPVRRFRVPILLGAAGIALYVLLGGTRGVMGLYRLHRDVSSLQRQLHSARSTVDSLEVEILRLRSDTAYIERVARQKLGMARRDEQIYKFVKEPE